MPVTITATRTTSLFTDQDNDGKVDLGDTLFIRLDLANTGNTDALNAVVNDALLGQSLVAGSINISPVAINYVFNAVGNTQLLVGTGATGLAGPSLSFGGAGIVSNVNLVGDNFTTNSLDAGTFATTGGGSVVISANGTFAYNPAAGFSGADTFTYTLRDTGQDGIAGNGDDLTSTARVTINIASANTVWYVDTSKASNGDGTSDNPFNIFSAVNGAVGPDLAGQTIYVQGNVAADVVLLNQQSLIGTGAALVVGGYTLAAAGTANQFSHSTGTGVLLATDNTLRGFDIFGGGTTGIGIADNNGSVGNLTISNMNITGSGQAVDIDQGGNLNVALGTLSSLNAGTNLQGVQLAGTASSGAGLIQGSFSATGGTIQGSNSHGFQIGSGNPSSGGTIAVDYDGAVNTSLAASVVHITNRLAGAGTISFDGNINQSSGGGNTASGIVMNTLAGGTINFTGTKTVNITSGTLNNIEIINNSGATVNFSGGALDLDNVNGNGFSIGSQTGGAVNVSTSADIDATGTGRGVSVSASTGGAINFTGGGVTISTASGTGIASATGTALTVTGAGNTITTGTGQILDLATTSLGAGGMNFASLSTIGTVASGTAAINLNGASGGALSTTTATIAGTSGAVDGVNITNASNAVTLSGGSIGNAGGQGVEISGGTGAVTIGASLTKTSAGNVVQINGHNTGNVTFSNNISATGAVNNGIFIDDFDSGVLSFTGQTINLSTGASNGVTITDSAGGTINFAPLAGGNGLDIVTTTGTGFTATGGGTVSVTQTGTVGTAGNTIAAGNGTALNINGVNIGAADVIFQSISSSGGTAAGIVLINTGASGGLTVTGFDGADPDSLPDAGSGGTIANKTGSNAWTFSGGVPALTGVTDGVGIYMQSTRDTSISGMQLNGFSNAAISSFASSNFSLAHSVVNGVNGNDSAQQESSLFFHNLTGTGAITGGSYEGGFNNNLVLLNQSGTLNRFTVDGATFGLNNSVNGNNNIQVESQNAGTTLNFTLQNSTIKGARADWLNASNNSLSTMDIDITNNVFSNLGANANPGAAPGGNRVVLGAIGPMTFDIDGNTLNGSLGEAIRVRGSGTAGGQTGNATGFVRNNNIGTVGVADSGSAEGSGIFIFGDGGSDMNVVIDNNDIFQYNNHGISLQFGDEITNGSRFYVTLRNNLVNTPGPGPNTDHNGFQLNSGTVGATDDFTVTLDMSNNDFRNSGSGAIPPNNNDIRVRQRQGTTVELPGYAGPARDNGDNVVAEVNAYLAGRGNQFNSATANSVSTGGGYVNGAAPPAPLMVNTPPLSEQVEVTAQGEPTLAAQAAISQAEQPQQSTFFGPGNKFNGIPGALGFANDAAPMDVVKIYDPVTGKLFDNEAGAAAADAERGRTGAAPAAGGQQTSGATAEGQQAANAPGEKGGPDLVQVVAAPAVNPIADDGVLTQAELDFLVDAAIKRWIEAGATEEQVAAMRATKFSTADLGGLFLGKSNPGAIILDDNAAGHNWYLDATPGDDAEFRLVGGVLRGAADTIEGSRVDLLTAIMHELGHQIGLEDSYDAADNGALMYGFVNPGERHLPGSEEVAEGTGAPVASTALALGAINFGTLEAGTTRSISWKTTYDGPGTNRVITDVANKSTVTYNNGAGNVVVDSTTNTLGTGTFPAVDSLTLGGTVWNDNGAGAGGIKGNGARDGTEAGINGVTMALFVDANNDNVADTPGTSIATATTAGGGNYSFANLAPGNYIVRVDQTNFDAGGALVGAQTSSVTSPEPVDPDDNVDNDDNGARSSGNPAFSYALTLDYNSEPTTEDGDADTNFTLDFGFLTPNQAPTFASPSAQPTYNENAPFVVVAPSVTVSDENANFNGGTVTIALTSGGQPGDVVGIATSTTPGTGIEINVGTGAVSYNGTVIGTATSATSVTLNAAATTAAIQALAQAVVFTSSSENPTATPRVLTFTFNDGGGTASGGVSTTSFTRTITVVPSDDAPVAVADSYATDENVILNVAAGSGVLFNDTDVDGGVKTVASINGNPANVGVAVTLASGAKVTLNADGSLSYDPNGVYNYLVPAGSGAVNTSAIDSFTYALNGGSSTTVSVTVNGVAGAGDQLRGDGGNNTINGTNGDDSFRLQQGGDDNVTGGDGNDGFYFGAAFTGADQVDGGAGTNDQIGLQGNYAALSLTSAMIANVEVIALLSGGVTSFGDTANNFYDYNITVGAGVVAANNRLTIQGTSLRPGEDFTFNGSASGIDFILYGGQGVDTFTGGSGNDGFYFGEGRFSSSDNVNGGAGSNDQLGLDGNYGSAGTPFELSGANISGIEVVALLQFTGAPLKTYFISTNNSLVGAGQNLTIWALPTQTGVTVDGSAETDGRFTFFGGAGADRFTGGNGGDSLTGGGGADTFAYTNANQSTGFNFDRLIGFDDSADKIDLPGAVASFAAPASGTLSLMSFNADLAAGVNAALGPNQAIVFTANGGDLAGRIFGVVDANGDGNYTAGTDYVFEFVNPVTPIDQVGMFI